MIKDRIDFVKKEYYLNPNHDKMGLESAHEIEYIECLAWMEEQNSKIPFENFIEIGSAWGASFHLWSTIVSGKKLSIDICGPYPGNFTIDHMNERNMIWSTHFNNVYSINSNSHAQKTVDWVEKTLDGELVSWLYIDAEHTYEAAKTEFELYNRFVRPGGYVGFHDIMVNELPSLNDYWNELSVNYKSWLFGNSKGKYYNIPLIGVIQI